MLNQTLYNYLFENYCISISEKEQEEIIKIISEEIIPKDITTEIFNFYNKHRNKMQEAQILSDTRISQIKSRVKKFGADKVKEVIILSSKSDFMNGINSQEWKANLDWIIKPTNFIKILEGNFKNKSNAQQRSGQPNRNR